MRYAELQDRIGALLYEDKWKGIVESADAKGRFQSRRNGAALSSMEDLAGTCPVSIQHAREKLGWEPRYRLCDTLPEMVALLKDNPTRWQEENNLRLSTE